MDDLGPLHCGLMHKYIWEDAERGNFRRPDPVQFLFYANEGMHNASISMFHWMSFFPSNAFMAFARSFNMFYFMLQIGLID